MSAARPTNRELRDSMAAMTTALAELRTIPTAPPAMRELRLMQTIDAAVTVAVDQWFVRWMQAGTYRKAGQDYPAVKVMYSSLNEAGTAPQFDVFPGTLGDVVAQLGVKLQQVIIVPPGPLNPPAPVPVALDLAGKTSPVEIAAEPDKPSILVVKGWQAHSNGHRDHWGASVDGDVLVVVEHHSGGFTIKATGFVGYCLEGDTGFVTVASLTPDGAA